MWWMVIGAATASDGVRGSAVCTATWEGPHDPCYLWDSVAVEHAGPNEKKARKFAQARMGDILASLAEASDIQVAGPALVAQCRASAVIDINITCEEAPLELRDEHLCFVDLGKPVCGEKPIINERMVGWEAWSRGVSRMCREVHDAVADADSSDETRAECKAKCLEAARVRCVQ